VSPMWTLAPITQLAAAVTCAVDVSSALGGAHLGIPRHRHGIPRDAHLPPPDQCDRLAVPGPVLAGRPQLRTWKQAGIDNKRRQESDVVSLRGIKVAAMPISPTSRFTNNFHESFREFGAMAHCNVRKSLHCECDRVLCMTLDFGVRSALW